MYTSTHTADKSGSVKLSLNVETEELRQLTDVRHQGDTSADKPSASFPTAKTIVSPDSRIKTKSIGTFLSSMNVGESNAGNRKESPSHFDVLYWSHFLLGCAFLTPWSAFLSTIDYFNDIYPDYHVLQWISVCFIPAKLLIVLFNGLIPTSAKGHSRVSFGLLLLSLSVLSIPIIDWIFIRDGSGTHVTFGVLLLFASITGFADGISEGSFVGIAMYLPPRYYQGYLRGDGFSALLVVMLRALTKAAFTDSSNGLRLSASVFFVVASLICIASLAVHRCFIVKHEYFQQEPLPGQDIEEHSLFENDASAVITEPSYPTRLAGQAWWEAASTLKMACLSVFLTCFVTLTIYPAVPADVENATLGDWYGVLLVAIFSICDFAGRQLPDAWLLTQSSPIMIFVLMRILLIPASYFAARSCANPFLISILILIVAVTQGYFCMCSFGLGHQKMQAKKTSFDAGNVLAFAVMAGLSCGSVASVILATL